MQSDEDYERHQSPPPKRPKTPPPKPSTNPQTDELLNLSKAMHPIICLLHLGFKAAAVFCYLFLKLITQSSIHTFISVIILCSVDFWFVKNVAGRVLVGLRWWNGEEETGREGWVFESYSLGYESSEVDKFVFWWGMSISTAAWAVLLFVKVLGISLFWGMLTFIGFILQATNLYGYYLCKKDHQEKVRRFMNTFGKNYEKYMKMARDSFSEFSGNAQKQ